MIRDWLRFASSRHRPMVPFCLGTSTKLLHHSEVSSTPRGTRICCPEVDLFPEWLFKCIFHRPGHSEVAILHSQACLLVMVHIIVLQSSYITFQILCVLFLFCIYLIGVHMGCLMLLVSFICLWTYPYPHLYTLETCF